MIDSLHAKDYESHVDSTLSFHKGVNCIIGTTDGGKSGLRRTLEWNMLNTPSGDSFRPHWDGIPRVEVTADGKVVLRELDKKGLYKLDDAEFKSFGTKVPDEIKEHYNVNEVNVQEQIDNFFLLDETPGYVASYLNKIANIEQIDSTTKAIKSELNQTKRTIEHKKADIKRKEAEIKTFEFLYELSEAIKDVEALKDKQDKIEDDIVTVSALLRQLQKIDAEIEENAAILLLAQPVEKVLADIALRKEFDLEYEKLSNLIDSLTHAEHQITKCAEVSDLKPLIEKVFKYKSEQSVLSTEIETLESLTYKLTEVERKLKETKEKHATLQNKYDSELKAMGQCFVCGSKIK